MLECYVLSKEPFFLPCLFTKIDHVPFIKKKTQISKRKAFTANICLYYNLRKLEFRKKKMAERQPLDTKAQDSGKDLCQRGGGRLVC